MSWHDRWGFASAFRRGGATPSASAPTSPCPTPSTFPMPASPARPTAMAAYWWDHGVSFARSPHRPVAVDALVTSARPLLQGVDWSTVRDVWVGPRPVSADGLPLVGATKVPGVFVAGGHGMWGITLARSRANCWPNRSSLAAGLGHSRPSTLFARRHRRWFRGTRLSALRSRSYAVSQLWEIL